jgi:catechol 2,3-dioxygenase-like lactoylglutathione lyase family enzyme
VVAVGAALAAAACGRLRVVALAWDRPSVAAGRVLNFRVCYRSRKGFLLVRKTLPPLVLMGRLPTKTGGRDMALEHAQIATRLPAQDLERARRWYSTKLGLNPVEERPGGLRYLVGGAEFAIFQSAGRPDGSFTQLAFTVDDFDAEVAELRSRGVVFEEYDSPGLETVNGVAQVEGNYPSKGDGERAAWFRDSEGNMLGMGQPIP